MPLDKLSLLIEELYNKRVLNHEIEYEAQHRLAGRVLNERTRSGESLIFHLNKFLGR